MSDYLFRKGYVAEEPDDDIRNIGSCQALAADFITDEQ